MLAEGGLTVALALALSYLKIPVAALGGSIDFVMVPLIVFAYRWGVWQGLLAGLAFGTLKFFLAGGSAINWQSMLLDYSVAYAFVGFAGLIHKKKGMLPVSALIGCIARFIIHFISGVTIYAEYAEPTADFFGLSVATPGAILFSVVYNGFLVLVVKGADRRDNGGGSRTERLFQFAFVVRLVKLVNGYFSFGNLVAFAL